MLKKNQILTLTINGMTFAGFGVAHYSDEELSRFAIFIQNAIEGDVIKCRIVKVQKTYAYGIIEEIIEPSPARIKPKCPVFEKCGGCVYLNATYEEELKYKTRLAADSFRNETYPHPEVLPCEPSPVIEHYRNKVTYPLSTDGKFGFYARNSHRCILNKDCVQQYEEFVPVLEAAERFIEKYNIQPYDEVAHKGVFRNLFMRRASATGEICVCAIINADKLPFEEKFAEEMSLIPAVVSVYINVNKKFGNELLGKEFRCVWGKKKITEKLCGLDFNISPAAFFQINKAQTERLYSYAIDSAEITEEDTVLDLYCGIGSITLTAASRSKAKEFVGIEIVPQAIEDAQENAKINGIENVSFYCSDAETVKDVLKKNGKSLPSVIIVDPPRKGLGKETSQNIVDLNPKKVVYISCNPLTQAQDLRTFAENGYKIEFIKPFDMFPRTQHVETVVLLSRKKADDHVSISVHTKNLKTRMN